MAALASPSEIRPAGLRHSDHAGDIDFGEAASSRSPYTPPPCDNMGQVVLEDPEEPSGEMSAAAGSVRKPRIINESWVEIEKASGIIHSRSELWDLGHCCREYIRMKIAKEYMVIFA